jgi:two-component system OmpR family response regulator
MTPLEDNNVLALTPKGNRELRQPGTQLTPVQLEALVLIDGFATVEQVLKRGYGIPSDILRASLNELLGKRLVAIHSKSAGDFLDLSEFLRSKPEPSDGPASSEQKFPEVDADTEFLQRHGYFVNLARRAATRENVNTDDLTILIIDDDPIIVKTLEMLLKVAKFHTRVATNHDEVVAELRRPPLPDMVLLDVSLTDVNGFDILVKMRQHALLRHLPVIMLTASATREAVLRGLMGGADGYITKPFQVTPLIMAIKAVLGLSDESNGQEWDNAF